MFDNITKYMKLGGVGTAIHFVINMLDTVEPEIEKGTLSGPEINYEVCTIAYISRNEILDRIDKYNWDKETLLQVPAISMGPNTISFALLKSIERLKELARKHDIINAVEDILNKGNSYYEFRKVLPDDMKNFKI